MLAVLYHKEDEKVNDLKKQILQKRKDGEDFEALYALLKEA